MQYLRTNGSRNNPECSKTKLSPNSSSFFSSHNHFSNGRSVSSSKGVPHQCSQEFCFDASCLSNARSPTHSTQLLSSSSSSSSINSRSCEASETVSSLNPERTSFLKRISAKKFEPSGRGKELCGKGKMCPPEASSPVRYSLLHLSSLFINSCADSIQFKSEGH